MDSNHEAKLFTNGGSQAVRLPQGFRFAGDRVRIRRAGTSVILEPVRFDVDAWFKAMDSIEGGLFLEDDRNQPETPIEDYFS